MAANTSFSQPKKRRLCAMAVYVILFTWVHFALPFVAPFAAGAGTQTSPVASRIQQQISPPLSQAPQAQLHSRSSSSGSSHLEVANSTAVSDDTSWKGINKQSEQPPPPLLNDDDSSNSWKGGEAKASIPSKLFFRYASPLLKTASQRRLDADDIFDIPSCRKMDTSVTSLTSIYNQQQEKSRKRIEQQKQRSKGDAEQVAASQSWLLTRTLFLHQRRMLMRTGILRLANTIVQAFPAIFVGRLLRLVEAGDAHNPGKAISTAISLVAVLTVKMVVENAYFHNVVKFSTEVRGALAGLIFDKGLRLPGGGSSVSRTDNDAKGGKQELGTGGVLNLMQSDTGIIELASLQVHTTWDGLLQIAIYSALLFKYLGPPVFWGIGLMLIVIPINSATLRVLNRLAKFENEAKDARIRKTTESITNMKLLKLQSWEQRFGDDIRGHRRDELNRHVTRGLVRALNSAISYAVPALVLVVTLTAYVKTGKPIVASTIFTAISLFNQLRFPLWFYPMLIDSLANGRNAMKRISSYLATEEIEPYVHYLPPVAASSLPASSIGDGGSIKMKNGNFLWSKNSASSVKETPAAPSLADVELEINPGEVVAVVGSVGSGKSALIKALLGELNPAPRTIIQQAISSSLTATSESNIASDPTIIAEKPSVISNGNIAYCSQEAWLPRGTIRDAIVFGREFDESRYEAAIWDSGLDLDLNRDAVDVLDDETIASQQGFLSHDTNVGEGGSSLSGGQRARVALARALYAGDDTKVFLLDDCLSALDASVGATVFERLTRRLRNSNAATILVTNDPNLPRRCDRVILMQKVPGSSSCSSILDVGTYDELISRGRNLRSVSTAGTDEMAEQHINDEDQSYIVSQEVVASPKITKKVQNTILAAGGYPANSTDQTCCHADPETEIGLENCPDYIADHVVPVSPDVRETDDIRIEKVEVKGPASIDQTTREDSVAIEAVSPVAKIAPTAALQEPATVVSRPEKKNPKTIASADDSMSTGAVPFSTYITYYRAIGAPVMVVAMLATYLMNNGAQVFQSYTISKWTELVHGSAMATAQGAKYLRRLVHAAGALSVVLWFRNFLTMKVGVRASEVLHKRMLNSVFAAPMSFFDATPSGQLLSRFGKEMETVDRGIPDNFGAVIFCFLQIFMSIGALAGVITPVLLIPLTLVGVLYAKAMGRFRPAIRDMKRAETKTRSPIYTHFGEALRGTETIRSIPGAQNSWSLRHRSLSDKNLGVFKTVKVLDRWLSTRLESLGNTVVFTAAVASVFLTRAGRIKAGAAGWGLTQALSITGLMTWAVRVLTDLETNIMSVLRIKELSDLDSEEAQIDELPSSESIAGSVKNAYRIPKEPANAGEGLKPLFHSPNNEWHSLNVSLAPLDSTALVNNGWPWSGNIQFTNVSMRYNSNSPLVLKGVTLNVPPASTLGVVGRTGSGKSSLLLTLFRLVEIESGGSIEIDGVDIRSISLDSLRQSLAIIPQDPVLFAGTVAYNLDAMGKSSPEKMWQALEAASPGLAQQFRESGDGLNSRVSEGGKNLSLGQRQLICLARALLRNSRILVLDEATSSVDSKTDQEVQETIRREFVNKGVSVITVAHRLDTVLGNDKIAVLGSGQVLEYGSPDDLLSMPNGELRKLVDADRRNKMKGSKEPSRSQPLFAA